MLSPAIFPKAHTACSRTSSLGEDNNCTKIGTAPELITVAVSSDVPLATFVNAHAASNCNCGKSTLCKNSTNFPTTPVATTSLIGGLRSMESSLRNRVVASNCTVWSGLFTPSTICGRDSNCVITVRENTAVAKVVHTKKCTTSAGIFAREKKRVAFSKENKRKDSSANTSIQIAPSYGKAENIPFFPFDLETTPGTTKGTLKKKKQIFRPPLLPRADERKTCWYLRVCPLFVRHCRRIAGIEHVRMNLLCVLVSSSASYVDVSFAIASSRFSFRMAIIWSSRFRRDSSASADFFEGLLPGVLPRRGRTQHDKKEVSLSLSLSLFGGGGGGGGGGVDPPPNKKNKKFCGSPLLFFFGKKRAVKNRGEKMEKF